MKRRIGRVRGRDMVAGWVVVWVEVLVVVIIIGVLLLCWPMICGEDFGGVSRRMRMWVCTLDYRPFISYF